TTPAGARHVPSSSGHLSPLRGSSAAAHHDARGRGRRAEQLGTPDSDRDLRRKPLTPTPAGAGDVPSSSGDRFRIEAAVRSRSARVRQPQATAGAAPDEWFGWGCRSEPLDTRSASARLASVRPTQLFQNETGDPRQTGALLPAGRRRSERPAPDSCGGRGSGGDRLVLGERLAELAAGARFELADALLADAHLGAERLQGARVLGEDPLLDDTPLSIREHRERFVELGSHAHELLGLHEELLGGGDVVAQALDGGTALVVHRVEREVALGQHRPELLRASERHARDGGELLDGLDPVAAVGPHRLALRARRAEPNDAIAADHVLADLRADPIDGVGDEAAVL